MDGREDSAMGAVISGGRRPMEMMKPPPAVASGSCGSPFSSHESHNVSDAHDVYDGDDDDNVDLFFN